jgi:hypothetical protein
MRHEIADLEKSLQYGGGKQIYYGETVLENIVSGKI